MRYRLPLIVVAAMAVALAGCQQSIGERLYTADRVVATAANGVTAYAKSGAAISPSVKTALVQTAIAADATLDEAHRRVDEANARGEDPTATASPLIDSAIDLAESLARILARLKEDPNAR